MRQPIVPMLFAFAAGIALGSGTAVDPAPLWWALGLVLVLLLCVLLRGGKASVLCLSAGALFLLGILQIHRYDLPDPPARHIVRYADGSRVVLEGVIVEPPLWSEGRANLIVRASHLAREDGSVVPVEGKVLIGLEAWFPLRYGDRIRCRTTLRRPRNFGNPGAFDYERYLRHQEILVRGHVSAETAIAMVREGQGNVYRQKLESLREALKGLIRDHAPTPRREIVQAMILGNQREIPQDVVERFNRTGTSHIIAISGFNVGIIAVCSLFAARWILRAFPRMFLMIPRDVAATLFACAPVVVFTLIAGMGISVVRAAIMVLVFMTAVVCGRERDLYNTLALAALAILAVTPTSLFDVSFQLSFSAVWGILFFTPRLASLRQRKASRPPETPGRTEKALHGLWMFFCVTVSATAATLPLIVFYFNRASLVVIPSNLAVAPILGILAVPVSMAVILAAPLSTTAAAFLVKLSSALVGLSIDIVDFFDGIPGSSLALPTPTPVQMIAFWMLLACLALLLERLSGGAPARRRSWPWIVLASGVLALGLADGIRLHGQTVAPGILEVTAIDVGHGNATLISFPDGRRMLVDGGGFADGRFDTGRHVVAPYLWKRQIGRIDTVLLTHPHPDHLNGLPFLLAHFHVREFWSNGQTATTESYQDLVRVLTREDIPHRIVPADVRTLAWGDATLEVLSPPHPVPPYPGRREKYGVANDHAVVIRIAYRHRSLLLASDIGESVEARLVQERRPLESDVLFVSHHGSRTGSSAPFISAVRPRTAVISCGPSFHRDIPHPDVLDRLRQAGAKVYRTDRDGAIRIATDGDRLRVIPFRGNGGRPADGPQDR